MDKITSVLDEMSRAREVPKSAGRLLETIVMNLGTGDALHVLTTLSRDDEFFSLLGTDGQIVKSIVSTALASFSEPLLGSDGQGIAPTERAKLLDTLLEYQEGYPAADSVEQAEQPHTLMSLNTNSKGSEMNNVKYVSTYGLENLSVDEDQIVATIFGKTRPRYHDGSQISSYDAAPLAGADVDSDSDEDNERLVDEIFGKPAANPVRT